MRGRSGSCGSWSTSTRCAWSSLTRCSRAWRAGRSRPTSGRGRIIAPLQRLAKETGCALILTHHTVASGKVAGSKGLTDAARLVYVAKKDRENPGIRVLAIDKGNGPPADAVRYTIHGDGADTFIRWLDRDELAARRTAWRAAEPVPVRSPEQLVRGWLQAGSTGTAADCAAATGVPEGECERILDGLMASGVARSPRRLALLGRR
jgi:hypothetical protein